MQEASPPAKKRLSQEKEKKGKGRGRVRKKKEILTSPASGRKGPRLPLWQGLDLPPRKGAEGKGGEKGGSKEFRKASSAFAPEKGPYLEAGGGGERSPPRTDKRRRRKSS